MNHQAALFITCSADLLYPEAARAAVNVLERLGVEVTFPEDQVCCGQPWLNIGDTDGATAMARRYLETFRDQKAVVAISASCVDTIRNRMPGLFAPGSEEERAIRGLSLRTWEFSEYLTKVLAFNSPPPLKTPRATTYHVSCRSLRGLGIRESVENLLGAMLGENYKPLPDAEVCCGFGGSFSVKLPEISARMMKDKLGAIKSVGAENVVSLDLACLTHLKSGAKKSGLAGLQFIHLAQLLEEALAGGEK